MKLEQPDSQTVPRRRTEKESIQREETMSEKLMFWGYLHQNGTIQVKRWFGDHKDYTEDCEGNDFVQQVVRPFAADSREKAIEIITQRLDEVVAWK